MKIKRWYWFWWLRVASLWGLSPYSDLCIGSHCFIHQPLLPGGISEKLGSIPTLLFFLSHTSRCPSSFICHISLFSSIFISLLVDWCQIRKLLLWLSIHYTHGNLRWCVKSQSNRILKSGLSIVLSGAGVKDSCQRCHFHHSPPTQGLKVGPRVRGVPYLVSWLFSVCFRDGDTTAGADVTCEGDEIRALETDVGAPCPHHSSVWVWGLTQSDREGDRVRTPLGTWPSSSLQTSYPFHPLGSHLPLPSSLRPGSPCLLLPHPKQRGGQFWALWLRHRVGEDVLDAALLTLVPSVLTSSLIYCLRRGPGLWRGD